MTEEREHGELMMDDGKRNGRDHSSLESLQVSMGVRAAVFVCITSFLLGISPLFLLPTLSRSQAHPGALFTHWIADSLTLWKSPVTDEHLWTAASYYSILTKASTAWLHFIRSVVLLGAITILWSLNDLRAGNIMFDGGSICTPLFACLVLEHSSHVFQQSSSARQLRST